MKKFMLFGIIVSLLFISLSNCVTTDNQTQNTSDTFFEVRGYKGLLRLGMTTEQVLEIWDYPDDINRGVYTFGVHEQWIYKTGEFDAWYLYFEDGVLTSWQEP